MYSKRVGIYITYPIILKFNDTMNTIAKSTAMFFFGINKDELSLGIYK